MLPIKGTGIKVKLVRENVSNYVIQVTLVIQIVARPNILLDVAVILYRHKNLCVCVVKVKMCCAE